MDLTGILTLLLQLISDYVVSNKNCISSDDSASPEPMTTLSTSSSGPDSDPESSTSTDCSTSSTPTETSTTSSPTPDPTIRALTDSTTTETIWTSSDSTPSSESSASGVTSSQASAANESSVMVPVLSCLAVVFVVVVVVAVFFLWRRKRQADDVRKENNPSCLSVETNLHHKQDSFNVYDKLCHDNRRTNINNTSTTAANSRDNDNNDDYAYIDDPAINKGVVRLHHDRPVTTDGQHALTDPSVSGLEPDLSSTYTLARPTDNDIPDPQPPDYFILEERDKKECAEPTHYFILEERGEKNSAADTDTQQYFILEEKPEGGVGESSRSDADYFVLPSFAVIPSPTL
ncbi:cell wall integrity and stress response component 4-like [Pomacea canaliculata]|uniref:cell wall integrity and stress response component 4-like n=1 Tax=Pomacea canaliculata TaxID=400727 RepID=UPI000D734374|nr:cell wall integrity and stress response component 4-like [Pomacea canaliculata]